MRTILTLVVLLSTASVAAAQGEGRTGRVQQGLQGGSLVSAEVREGYGLVTLASPSGGCSGSLLRDNWVITAAHCVDDPDPANPGRFITVPENSVTVTADWRTRQTRQSMRVISFRPNDVAIIRFADPFDGPNGGFNRELYEGETTPLKITFYGRGLSQFASGSGDTATPSQTDGLYRTAIYTTDQSDAARYSFPTSGAAMPGGGDSGGPSYLKTPAGEVLVGVHSTCEADCLPGKTCAAPNVWRWATGTKRCADAAVGPLRDTINGYLGAFVPPKQFIGTFGVTPAGYQPIWVYAIKDDGQMLWYRKESDASRWLGPKLVGSGWKFRDVIPAGGNVFYALTDDGKLLWYRHNGFNDGSRNWSEAKEVGHGWRFSKIFSGGEGVVYAIQEDGTLLWYRHGGVADGGNVATWAGPRVVGSGWGAPHMKDVFSTGRGVIYAVLPDGKLSRYVHEGYATGAPAWVGPRMAGRGWGEFRQIVPAGAGVVLAFKDDGRMLLYRFVADELGRGPTGIGVNPWEGPYEIGTGWVGLRKVVALLPLASAPVVR